MLLIGSQALIAHGIDTGRRPLDWDVIASFDELQKLTSALRKQTRVSSIPLGENKTVLKCQDGRIIEVEIAWTGSLAHELQFRVVTDEFRVKTTTVAGTDLIATVAGLDHLYTLKMSHRYLKNSPHFRKTRDDIMLMRKNGAKIFDKDWLKRREDETYWYKHPKLNVDKKDFFKGDGVQYVYDHDTIHVAMAHVPNPKIYDWKVEAYSKFDRFVPAYTLYMKDGEQVQTSKEKFFAASEKIRLCGVLEEAQVLALERSQIPFRGKIDARKSFDIALQKVCTSITSGWFREFAWENFDVVESMYEPDYVDRFWKAVDDGIVRKLEPGEVGPY
jgi:hypothetical protein